MYQTVALGFFLLGTVAFVIVRQIFDRGAGPVRMLLSPAAIGAAAFYALAL